ncbi:MAG: alanine racemase [Desulfovibrionaceae bacterium]|nr:alanine racemase [Desulfovibrionaceae bacterium]
MRDLRGNDPLLLIDTGALARNFRLLRRELAPASRSLLMPVLKSDAYGHGLPQAGLALALAGAKAFCVGTVEEAANLRKALNAAGFAFGIRILALLGASGAGDADLALAEDITLMLHRPDQARIWSGRAVRAATPLRVAFKLNSGMNRLGLERKDFLGLLRTLNRNLSADLLCTHLATADQPEELDYAREQARLFLSVWREARQLRPGLGVSLGNSAGLLNLRGILSPEEAASLSLAHRPGIALYGVNPFQGSELESLGQGLAPVMSLLAPVLEVHDLAPGSSIGYGRTFKTGRDTRVAVLRAGYADGIPRLLSWPGSPAFLGGGEVILAGRKTRILGRVCMQMLMVEVPRSLEDGEYLPVRPGDWACLLGRAGFSGGGKRQEAAPEEAITARMLAERAGTIPYEIFCSLGRNRKIFI